MTRKVLVIQSESLRAFIDALPGMAEIRRKHADDHITLLTAPSFADVAVRSRYFNDVIAAAPPKWFHFFDRLARYFKRKKFDVVYDLEEVAIEAPLPDLSWMETDVEFFGLKKPYVLLFPGGGRQGWPQTKYTALALRLQRDDYMVGALGSDAEREIFSRIARIAPETKDLSGRTSLFDIATLAKNAAAIVGNDVAPLRLAELAGCPVVVRVGEGVMVQDVFTALEKQAAA